MFICCKLFTIFYSLFIELHVSEAFLVEVTGFEPATPSSRTMCATKLRYTSKKQPRNGFEADGSGIGIRTPTNRVRVCRATVTLFLKICYISYATLIIIPDFLLFVNSYFKKLLLFSYSDVIAEKIELLSGSVYARHKAVGISLFKLGHR